VPDGSKFGYDNPQVPADLHDRLLNWSKWANQRRWTSHCQSIEHRYLRPSGSVMEETEQRIKWTPDTKDAWHIECVWRTKLPDFDKLVVASYYIWPDRRAKVSADGWDKYRKRVCRVLLKIQPSSYADWVYRSAKMLGNRVGPIGTEGIEVRGGLE
jgi:hypothetical protein